MKSTSNIDRDSSIRRTNGKENKRSARAFGPVDINTFQGSNGRQIIPGAKPPFALPKSPNPTLKKKLKPVAVDSNGAGHQQPSQQATVTPPRNDDAILTAALDEMVIRRTGLAVKTETDEQESKVTPRNDDAILTAALDEMANGGAEPAVKTTTEVDWKPIQKELDALFVKQSKERMKGVPMIEMPKIFKQNGITLFEHQKDGIRWLTHKEVTNTDIPPYYKLRKYGLSTKLKYYCSIDSRACRDENGPQPIRHSILADDMGLGKTIQSIGLILSNPPAGRNGTKTYPYKMPRKNESAPPRCTIIIAPVSVMSNWKTEIDKFVHKKKKNILKVELYHGKERIEVLRKVEEGKLDILICSYHTLVSDLKKHRKMQSEMSELESPSNESAESDTKTFFKEGDPIIFDQEFHRIILDEAHMIRNAKTLFFQSVKFLNATHKLCLTGTPFVNHPRDIHSFLDFLDVAPCNNIETFNECIVKHIEERKEVGLARLRVLMGAVAIRRTKTEVGEIELPEKSVQIRKVSFPDGCEHKQINEMLYHTCRTVFLALGDTFGRKAFNLFSLVLRVRQSCCDANLVPVEVRDEIASLWEEFRDVDVDSLDEAEAMRLYDTVVKSLGIAKEKIESAKKESVPKQLRFGRPPKVQALIDAINEMKPDEKGVIFSQWVKYLDIIQRELELRGHSFSRIQGKMDVNKRHEALKCFNADDSNSMSGPRLMLCSLKACNTGINLTRANHIFIMDSWWNAAEENQAIDRVHRIGQTRPVRAIRFVMKDSIEERFIDVQDAKMALAKGSMERLKKADRDKASITALKDLFELECQIHVWEGTFVDDDDAEDDGFDLKDFIVPDDHFE